MILEFTISILLAALTVLTHYEVLRFTSASLAQLAIPPRRRILVVIFAAFFAHLIEITYYAAAFYLLVEVARFGTIVGEFSGTLYDYLYLSISTYTSLGIGDLYPKEQLRFLTGSETLTGLMMITWSASFTYLAMEKFWDLHGPPKQHGSWWKNRKDDQG